MPDWQEQLRTFHLTGQGLEEEDRGPLRPVAVAALEAAGKLACDYPAYLSTEPSVRPLQAILEECVRKEPDTFPQLAANVAAVAQRFGDGVGAAGGTRISAVRDAVLAGLGDLLPEAEIARLRLVLPKQGSLFPCDAAALPVLYGGILSAARQWARSQWLAKLTASRNQLRALLEADETHEQSPSPEDLEAKLGVEGQFFNPAAMARVLGHTKGPRRMDGARRQRIDAAVAVLEAAVKRESAEPAARVFHSGDRPAGAGELRWECVEAEDSFAAAVDFLKKAMRENEAAWRAVRLARVEAESAFDEAVHPERLARFTWHAAEADELRAMTPVVVLEDARRVAESSLTGFGRLLRSGLPVQVLITCAGVDTELPDIGYLAMAYQKAFVLSTSMARLHHFAAGLGAMCASLEPAVAVIATPGDGEGWREASVGAAARVQAIYRYDPELGVSWRDRFAMLEPDGAPGELSPAHAAAMSPAMRKHFRRVNGHDGALMELSEYLDRFEKEPPLAVPFVWATGEGGQPEKFALTRELAEYCHDRRIAWHTLAELAGVDNAYVTAAVDATRQQERAEASAREEKARGDAALAERHNAVARLVSALVGGDPIGAGLFEVAAEPAPVPTVADAPAAPAAEAAGGDSGDAYIESSLCTSCNDCIKLNPRLFVYNADQQAKIGDAAAGTFAELVKAAEKCPARCIHPGAPRAGDATATPAMLVRAAKFA